MSRTCFWPKICTHGCLSRSVSQGSSKVHSFGMIWIRINIPRSVEAWYIKANWFISSFDASRSEWLQLDCCYFVLIIPKRCTLGVSNCNNWRLDHKLTRNLTKLLPSHLSTNPDWSQEFQMGSCQKLVESQEGWMQILGGNGKRYSLHFSLGRDFAAYVRSKLWVRNIEGLTQSIF